MQPRRRLKTAEATVNWLISKVRESTGKKTNSCTVRCDSRQFLRSENRSRAVSRWKISQRARLEKEKCLRTHNTHTHIYKHIHTRVYTAHVAAATSARTARVAAAAPRNSRVSPPFMTLICSRRCTRKCAKHSGRCIPKRTPRIKRHHCYEGYEATAKNNMPRWKCHVWEWRIFYRQSKTYFSNRTKIYEAENKFKKKKGS